MIRVQVRLTTANNPYKTIIDGTTPFFIDPMPGIPRKGENINLNAVLYNVRVPSEVFSLLWFIDDIEWEHDEEGYYIRLVLVGE